MLEAARRRGRLRTWAPPKLGQPVIVPLPLALSNPPAATPC
jgi:hypothetical protein